MNMNLRIRFATLSIAIISACSLLGCSHTTSTQLVSSGPVTKTTQFSYLVAGGTKWPGILRDTVDGLDSFVYFDFHRKITITNSSGASQHLFATWGIFNDSARHVILPNKQTASVAGLLWESDGLDLGTIPANAFIVLDTSNVVKINQNLTHTPLSYTLYLSTLSDPSFDQSTALFDSVPFASRYRGYIYSTESSPNPIAIMDAPDPDDWHGSNNFVTEAAYPNPANGSTEFVFEAFQPVDSVQLDLHITPGSIVRSFLVGQDLPLGVHSMMLDLTGLAPGLYRLMITAWQGSTVTHSHGDIRVE